MLFFLVTLLATVHSFDGMGTETSDAKNSWPEVVGKTGEEAKTVIETEDPGVKAEIIDENAFVTMDFRMDRVRIRVNGNDIVTQTPRIG